MEFKSQNTCGNIVGKMIGIQFLCGCLRVDVRNHVSSQRLFPSCFAHLHLLSCLLVSVSSSSVHCPYLHPLLFLFYLSGKLVFILGLLIYVSLFWTPVVSLSDHVISSFATGTRSRKRKSYQDVQQSWWGE